MLTLKVSCDFWKSNICKSDYSKTSVKVFFGTKKKPALTENALIILINRKLGFQTTFRAVLDHLEQHKWSHLRDDIKTFRMELHIVTYVVF